MKDTRAEIKEVREKMASSTEKRNETMKKRADNVFDKTTSRMEATIEREEIIMAKITARIEKIKMAGGKTASAEKLVAEAKTDFVAARVALDSLKALVDTGNVGVPGTASTSIMVMNDILAKMKAAGKEAEKDIRLGHQSLMKAVGVLRGVSELRNATSTEKIKTNAEVKIY